ncbi:MAG TPA: hypothetical protein PKY01_17055 [Candidatus Hydrogenedentes bacterium]|nr:hypothetical protein [Candidatus Hydrogenedentota bacterium]
MDTELTIGTQHFCIQSGIVRVLSLQNQFIDEILDPETTLREIKQQSVRADLLTFLQLPPATSPKFPYHLQWDNLAVLEISSYENWFTKQIHQNPRNKVRKAEKIGVTVQVETFSDRLAAGLVELFNETPTRRGRRYAYFGWDLEMVKHGWATELDRSLFLVAYYREELIGFIKLTFGQRLARTSGTIAKQAHKDKAPMNALFAKAVEVCAARGVPLLVYGKYSYRNNGEDSLMVFKKYNGFRRIDVPRYYVPLSTRGRIGLALGLHRSASDLIPGPVLRLLLNLRSRWQQATEKN